jgi:hypothetical protein
VAAPGCALPRRHRPRLITSNVDNDAGGIYSYSLAGHQFGYLLL